MRHKGERGQAVLMVLIATGLFLLAAIGLAIDGSNLYTQRQMAQAAADAGAQAAMLSVFDGTNTSGPTAFSTSDFTCATADARTPCAYAGRNGFGIAAGDTISVGFNAACVGPTTGLASDPVNRTCVTITRNVSTTLLRLLGPASTSIRATATAAVLNIDQSPPILVLDPTMPGALDMQGNPSITITGGPSKSIQVNSGDTNAFTCGGDPNLSAPGSIGTWGGPDAWPCKDELTGGGSYLHPASIIQDPLATVPAPADPGPPANPPCRVTSNPASQRFPCIAGRFFGCPTGDCMVYSPGNYAKITIKNENALFMPGLYYVQDNGDFALQANGNAMMANCSDTFVTPDPITGCGMVVYFSGSGGVSVDANAGKGMGISLLGAPNASVYKGILFFSRHTGSSNLGGGGTMIVTGTVYLPNQAADLGGGSGSTTNIMGEIIVDSLSMGGNGDIVMTLDPAPTVILRQVALVH